MIMVRLQKQNRRQYGCSTERVCDCVSNGERERFGLGCVGLSPLIAHPSSAAIFLSQLGSLQYLASGFMPGEVWKHHNNTLLTLLSLNLDILYRAMPVCEILRQINEKKEHCYYRLMDSGSNVRSFLIRSGVVSKLPGI